VLAAQRLESFAEATKGGSATPAIESGGVGLADAPLFEPPQRPGTPEGSPERRRGGSSVGASMLAANLSDRLDAFEDKMKSARDYSHARAHTHTSSGFSCPLAQHRSRAPESSYRARTGSHAVCRGLRLALHATQ
jgi:hypothetical protein